MVKGIIKEAEFKAELLELIKINRENAKALALADVEKLIDKLKEEYIDYYSQWYVLDKTRKCLKSLNSPQVLSETSKAVDSRKRCGKHLYDGTAHYKCGELCSSCKEATQ